MYFSFPCSLSSKIKMCSFTLNLVRSDQISCSVVSDSLRPRESQHARPPCPSPTPGVHSNSRPLSWWCHPAISSSVVHFSCSQSFPASESFPMSQLFAWGGQSNLVKARVFPVVRYGCESWTVKKAEHQRIDAFELWCWRNLWESLGLQGDPTSPF